MKYKVSESGDGLDIEVDDAKDKKEKLLEAFTECREGRCSCPTEEYKKLDSLTIDKSEGGVRLHLKSKPGKKLDKGEIDRCLEYTAGKLHDEED